MANFTLVLFALCIVGIWYAGIMYDNGRIARFNKVRRFIERMLLPTIIICAAISFILA